MSQYRHWSLVVFGYSSRSVLKNTGLHGTLTFINSFTHYERNEHDSIQAQKPMGRMMQRYFPSKKTLFM